MGIFHIPVSSVFVRGENGKPGNSGEHLFLMRRGHSQIQLPLLLSLSLRVSQLLWDTLLQIDSSAVCFADNKNFQDPKTKLSANPAD